MSQPAAGWYPDPVGSQRLRWWNGGSWTEQYQPMPTQQQRMPQQGIPHQGMPQHGMQTQGFPQQGMGQQAPIQAMPTGAPNPGAPDSAQAAVAQGASAQQTSAPVGPHLPSIKQARFLQPLRLRTSLQPAEEGRAGQQGRKHEDAEEHLALEARDSCGVGGCRHLRSDDDYRGQLLFARARRTHARGPRTRRGSKAVRPGTKGA